MNESFFEDPSFLNEYILDKRPLSHSPLQTKGIILNSQQKILLTKVPMQDKLTARFTTLVHLFQEGIFLADNIFLTKEEHKVFINVVTVDLDTDGKFKNLKEYSKGQPEAILVGIIHKVKELVERVHSAGESCLNLSSDSIIIDASGNVYLDPFVIDQGEFLEAIKNQEESSFARITISPDILEQLFATRDGRLQISRKALMKSDYWALGCVILETFVLATSPFLSVDYCHQLELLESLPDSLKEWVEEVPQSFRGLLLNCL